MKTFNKVAQIFNKNKNNFKNYINYLKIIFITKIKRQKLKIKPKILIKLNRLRI